ncbi:MAG: dihydropteroate synthase, partial [Gammaproteobacteria bacterium]|nr:dihydropteroate synthase [Gammaproteobacteria bacterium]
ERSTASLAAAVVAVMSGARIIRTHDVKPTVEALKVCYSIQSVTADT